jgi:hypothetical protein
LSVTTADAKRHWATFPPKEASPEDTTMWVSVKVAEPWVMNVGPVTVAVCPGAGRVTAGEPSGPADTMATGATAGAAVAALAVDTGAAVAIVLRAAAIPTRRVAVGFMSNLPFICV